jgi:hypothetical protein
MITLDSAKENFCQLLAGISTNEDRVNFLNWIRNSILPELPPDCGLDPRVIDARTRLRIISEFARQLVPNLAGVFPSENENPPVQEPGKVVEALVPML